MLTLEEVKKIVKKIENNPVNDEKVYCLECENYIMPTCRGENNKGERVCPVCGSKYIIPSKEYRSFSSSDIKDIRYYISEKDDISYLLYLIVNHFSLDEKMKTYWPYFDKVLNTLEEKGIYEFVAHHANLAFLLDNFSKIRYLYELAMEKGIKDIFENPEPFYYSGVLKGRELYEFLATSSILENHFASLKVYECLTLGVGVKKNPMLAYSLGIEMLREVISFYDYNFGDHKGGFEELHEVLLIFLNSLEDLSKSDSSKKYLSKYNYYKTMVNFLAEELCINRYDDEIPLKGHYINFDSLNTASDIYNFDCEGRISDFRYDKTKKTVSFKIEFDRKYLIANAENRSCALKKTFRFKDVCTDVYNPEGASEGFEFDYFMVFGKEIRFFYEGVIISSIFFE